MDAPTKRRRHRLSTEPYVASDGHIVEREVRPRDIELLKLFAHHRLISAPYAAAFLGGNGKAMSRRMRDLKEDGVKLIKIAEAQAADKNLVRVGFLYYDLDEAGESELREDGVVVSRHSVPKTNLAHAIMTEQIVMSLALGARGRDDIVLRHFNEIIPQLPQPTREAKHPLRIYTDRDHFVMADHPPLAIERTSDGKRRHIFLEADTGTQPIKSYDRERSAVCNKFAQQIRIAETGMIEKQFGFQSYLFAWVTAGEVRCETMMQALHDLTEHRPSLRKRFIFKVHPTIKSRETPRATGHMMTEPWKRADNPDLYLDRTEGGK